jgi:hypothetical protein
LFHDLLSHVLHVQLSAHVDKVITVT